MAKNSNPPVGFPGWFVDFFARIQTGKFSQSGFKGIMDHYQLINEIGELLSRERISIEVLRKVLELGKKEGETALLNFFSQLDFLSYTELFELRQRQHLCINGEVVQITNLFPQLLSFWRKGLASHDRNFSQFCRSWPEVIIPLECAFFEPVLIPDLYLFATMDKLNIINGNESEDDKWIGSNPFCLEETGYLGYVAFINLIGVDNQLDFWRKLPDGERWLEPLEAISLMVAFEPRFRKEKWGIVLPHYVWKDNDLVLFPSGPFTYFRYIPRGSVQSFRRKYFSVSKTIVHNSILFTD